MGVLNNPAAAKIIINGPTQYGNVSDPFTISYSVYDTDPGGDLGLDFFLDDTCVWFDSKKFDVLMNKTKPSIVLGVPTLFEALINCKNVKNLDLSYLKYIVSEIKKKKPLYFIILLVYNFLK